MTGDIRSFLSRSPVFRNVPAEQLDDMAELFQEAQFPVGAIILNQGSRNEAVYFLRSGRLAVRVHTSDGVDTVAYLNPPQCFGELSFLTGRPCVADVAVAADATVVFLPQSAVARLPHDRQEILRGLMMVIAERLQETVSQQAKAPDSPIVLLRNHPGWEAPASFASELARSLARQTRRETLLVHLGRDRQGDWRPLGENATETEHPAGKNLRADLAERIGEWTSRFEIVLLNVPPSAGKDSIEDIQEFANCHGDLLGPGDPLPPELYTIGSYVRRFAVQSCVAPTLPELSGSHQLIRDAAESETAWRSGGRVSAPFQRTVDSIARCVSGSQVGLALGGGAAWGFAHVGVLAVLEQAGLPVDVISGSSMGSVIGALRAAGRSVQDLRDIADYWRTRTVRFVEWRFWRMCLLNERFVLRVFRRYFGDRTVNRTEIPFWANAVNINSGEEYWIRTGTLVNCIRCSIALPGLLPPLETDAGLLVDAGIMNPVPVHLVRAMGCHYAVAVNVMAEMAGQQMRRRYPFNAFEVMMRCMQVMGHEIGEARAQQAADVLFTPDLGTLNLLQFARCRDIIECGVRSTEANLPAILEGYERLKARAFNRFSQKGAI
jgi:NTE family protein